MSLQGWQVHVIWDGLRPSNVSTALHLASFFGKPSAQYSSLLHLVFFSSQGCDCDRASIYMSLQGWQANVFRQAVGLSSAHCASSEGCQCDRASIYMSLQGWQVYVFQESLRPSTLLCFTLSSVCDGCQCDRAIYMSLQGWQVYVIWEGLRPSTLFFLTLSSFLLKAVNVIGLVSICHCKGGRFMSFGTAFGLVTCPLLFTLPLSLGSLRPSTLLFFTLSSFLLKAVIVIGLVSICPCKGGRLMFLGRPQASLLLIVLLLKAVNVIGLVSICRCKGGRYMSFRKAFGLVHFSELHHVSFL